MCGTSSGSGGGGGLSVDAWIERKVCFYREGYLSLVFELIGKKKWKTKRRGTVEKVFGKENKCCNQCQFR